jgi:hypothetical protein
MLAAGCEDGLCISKELIVMSENILFMVDKQQDIWDIRAPFGHLFVDISTHQLQFEGNTLVSLNGLGIYKTDLRTLVPKYLAGSKHKGLIGE